MNKLSEKDIQFYHAVFKLAENGRELSSLKVQEIADEADMGKGTLYEYFSSKEEIIQKTLFYFMNQQFEGFKKILEKEEAFEVILRKGLMAIAQGSQNTSAFQILLSNTGKISHEVFLEKGKKSLGCILPIFIEMLEKVVDLAIEHGVADINDNRSYLQYVIIGAVGAFNAAIQSKKLMAIQSDFSDEIEYAIKLIYRGFGKKNISETKKNSDQY